MAIVHVNRNLIDQNRKNGTSKPVLTVKDRKENFYCNRVAILDSEGIEVATIVYAPDDPLHCGAKVWIETRHPVRSDIRLSPSEAIKG